MKCVPILENKLKTIKLSRRQAERQSRLQGLLDFYQQEDRLSRLMYDSPSMQEADALELLQSSQYGNDYWLRTSGYLFNKQRAVTLKEAGLTGLAIRLDHYEPDRHNALQGYKHAYGWALKAADLARSTNLLLCLRLCPSREFITSENLFTYTRFAKKLGATFIQLVQPGTQHELNIKPATLGFDALMVLDDFTEMINYRIDFLNWPVISYQLAAEQKPLSYNGPYKRNSLFVDPSGKIYQAH